MIQKIIKGLIIALTVCVFGIMGFILKNKWDSHMPIAAKEECLITAIPRVGLAKIMVVENSFAEGLTYAVIIQPRTYILAGALPIPNAALRSVGFIRVPCFGEGEE